MIYLDNAATTPLLKEVVEEMTNVLYENYGNPSSVNSVGRVAKQKVEQSRMIVAQSIGATIKEVVFTSGATESNNTAILGLLAQTTKKHIITSSIEHPSVFEVMKRLEKQGYTVTYLPVDTCGCVSVESVKQAITSDTALISVMFVNNETGAIQPIEKIGRLAKENDVYFHVDAVQAYGQLEIDVAALNVDTLSVSAHKIHGPKGIGALYISKDVSLLPLLIGGSQEHNYRAGTENVASIVGFAAAVSQMNCVNNLHWYQELQSFLIEQLNAQKIVFIVNGALDDSKKVSKIVNIWLPNINSSKLLMQLDLAGVVVSAGSACSAGSLQPSRILQKQYPEQPNRASESIRISFSKMTTKQDVLGFVEKLARFTYNE